MKVLVVDDEIDMQPLFRQRFRKEIKSGEVIADDFLTKPLDFNLLKEKLKNLEKHG